MNETKTELAETKSQLCEIKEIAKQHAEKAAYYENLWRQSEAKLETENKAREDAEFALRQSQRELASTKDGLAQLAGDSHFVRIGKTLHRYSAINMIPFDAEGMVSQVNGVACFLEARLSAAALAAMVSADANRRRPKL